MNDDLKKMWDETERTGKAVPISDLVVCDVCGDDYTDSPEKGGMIFSSSAYCRRCTTNAMPNIIRWSEQNYIRAMCPEGVTFADFVRSHRGPNATIQILTGDDARKAMGQ